MPEKAVPEKIAGKKRKKADLDQDLERATQTKIIETFENEADLKEFYDDGTMIVSEL